MKWDCKVWTRFTSVQVFFLQETCFAAPRRRFTPPFHTPQTESRPLEETSPFPLALRPAGREDRWLLCEKILAAPAAEDQGRRELSIR